MNDKGTIWRCLLLAAVSLFLYLPSIHFSFVNFDEPLVLLAHPNLYNETSLIASLKEIMVDYFPREEPLLLRDISWAVDSRLFGFRNPFGYHLGNVIINSLNSALLYLFLFLNTRHAAASFLISLTFTVLPIHVEPVCWIMGRKDLLAAFFMLITFILQTLYLKNKLDASRNLFYLLTILTTLAAVLSKINAAVFFLALALHQVCFPYLESDLHRSSGMLHEIKAIVINLVPHCLISVGIFFWYKRIISEWGVIHQADTISVHHIFNLLTIIPLVILHYIRLIFYPFQLSLYYPIVESNNPLSSSQLVVSLVFIVLSGYFLWRWFNISKKLFFFSAGFIALMIPYFNLIGVGIWAANRYLYFSSFCIISIVMILVMEHPVLSRRYVKGVCLGLWCVFIGLNLVQTLTYRDVWKNDLSLWTYETGLKKPWILSFIFLANAYIDRSVNETDSDIKIESLSKAEAVIDSGLKTFDTGSDKRLIPHYYQFYYLLGVISELKGGSLEDQASFYQQAYSLREDDPDVLERFSKVYFKQALNSDNPLDQERLARFSIRLYERHIEAAPKDPYLQKTHRLRLKEYEHQFKYLSEETERIRRRF